MKHIQMLSATLFFVSVLAQASQEHILNYQFYLLMQNTLFNQEIIKPITTPEKTFLSHHQTQQKKYQNTLGKKHQLIALIKQPKNTQTPCQKKKQRQNTHISRSQKVHHASKLFLQKLNNRQY